MLARVIFVTMFAVSLVGLAFESNSHAQEATPEHIEAAKKALAATKATDSFDLILPNASIALKNRLSANNPNRADEIDRVVDEEALALASRRGVLETEAAKLFTASFSQEELEAVAKFFSTDVGQKYLASTPVLARELSKAARVWSGGVVRDLEINAAKRLQETAAKN